MIKADDQEKKDLYTYQQLIRKLIYLVYNTKSDIIFAIRLLSKHNANLRKNHLQVARKVIQHLKKTINLGLIYKKRLDNRGLL